MRLSTSFALLLAITCPGVAALGQVPYLVQDLDTRPPIVFFTPPTTLAPAPTSLLYDSGQLLYRTNGTAGGTSVVYEFAPEESAPTQLTRWNGDWYFAGTVNGYAALWRTDGTPGGTAIVWLCPDASGEILQIAAAQDLLYFRVRLDPIGTSEEIWRTDGTAEGVVLLRAQANQFEGLLFPYGDGILFRGVDAGSVELWSSDGSPEGTVLVRDIKPGPGRSFPSFFTLFNGLAYFAATGDEGAELWRTDGTAGGTALVADIRPGAADSAPERLTSASGWLFFFADDGVHGSEPWATDGTVEGTRMLTDLRPGSASANLHTGLAIADGSTVYFSATNGTTGNELYKSNGTTEGTMIVRDISPGAAATGLSAPVLNGGILYFAAQTSQFGRELWKSDGTSAGTLMVLDLYPGVNSGLPDSTTSLCVFDGAVCFGGQTSFSGGGLFRSNGTPAGTVRFSPVPPPGATRGFAPVNLLGVGDTLYFTPSTGVPPVEGLWKTRGSAATTVQLSTDDVEEGVRLPNAHMVGAPNGTVYFSSNGGAWRSYGTPGTTQRLRSTGNPLSPNGFAVLGNSALFGARTSAAGWELWSSDGTEAGTILVRDFNPGPLGSDAWPFEALDDCIVVRTSTNLLWRSDGTDGGTTLLRDFGADGIASIGRATRVGNRVFFLLQPADPPYAIGVTDGTIEGTFIVPGGFATVTVLGASNYGVLNGSLYFPATDGLNGAQLWRTDGTGPGTVMVRDILPDASDPRMDEFETAGNLLFFHCYHPDFGRELWATDGTEAGTRLVRDIVPGPASARPHYLRSYRGRLYFMASTPEAGLELWTSDGTEAGTRMIADVRPGARGSDVSHIGFAGDRVYFAADSGVEGLELWAFQLPSGDFDGSGAVNSQDFFDFLTAFFGGDARADLDWNGMIDSRDFFQFLSLFFG